MAIELPKQSFIALAAVGWADGSLKRSEAGALVDAAKQSGRSGDELAEIEQATKSLVSLDAFDPAGMSAWERLVTYALASWLACVDGVQSSDETATLAKLGEKLGIEEPVRRRAAAAAFDIAVIRHEGGKPERYDFDKLVTRLGEKLPQLKR